MKNEKLLSISPLDGRYSDSVEDLRNITSEYGLIRYRVIVEIKWFIHLSKNSKIKELPSFSVKDSKLFNEIPKATPHILQLVFYIFSIRLI